MMPTASSLHNPPDRSPSGGGYTLVELVVAATLLGLAISGVMSMIGSGRQMELENNLRRQARIVASGMLENPLYHFSRYGAFVAGQTIGATTLMADAETPVPATTRLIISSERFTIWNDIISGGTSASVGALPYRRMEARVSWTVAGQTQSVRIRKNIAQAGFF